MKKTIFLIFCFVFTYTSFAQSKSKLLTVYAISEYIDGYIIQAIDTSTIDTLRIATSKKEKVTSL